MDLIYMDSEKEDIDILHDYTLDLAFGMDENDFECSVIRDKHCCESGQYLYFEDCEYGGIIDDIGVDTDTDEVTYYGRTWHGILNSRILEPDPDADYLILNGEANAILQTIITRTGLDDLFAASTEDSGITVSNYQMDRYIQGYDGIRKMLKKHGAKLNIVFKEKYVVLSAKPVVDYSKDEQFDSSQIGLKIRKKGNPVNHVICLGKGELAEREVIHIYTDEAGNLSSTQILTGIKEVSETYENVNADTEELRQGGIDLIKESWNSDELEFNFDSDTETYDIGDIVGAREEVTEMEVSAEITKKIVTIKDNETTIFYKVGE